MVFYSRRDFRKDNFAGGGLEFSDLVQFVGAMLGNILVYLLGLLWSFLKHESIPDFSELRYELTEVQQKIIAAFNKYLTRRNQQHLQRAQKDVTQAQRVETPDQYASVPIELRYN